MTYAVISADRQHDRDRVLDLWTRNLPEAASDRYDWLYDTGMASGWLVRCGGGDVVGATGLMARNVKLFDAVVPAGQAIDLNIDRNHRSAGAALLLQRAITGAVDAGQLRMLYAFPNARSEPILRHVGYRVAGDLVRWAKPLRLGTALRDRFPRLLTHKVVAAVANPCLRLASAETFRRRSSRFRVEVTDRFDERFDALWAAAAGQFRIAGERTSDYLDWRFRRCPDVCYRVFLLTDRDGQLLAYLVYRKDARLVYVADFLFADVRHLDCLLVEFIRQMRREKAEAIFTLFFGSVEVCARLGRFGFWRRPSGRKTLVYAGRGQEGPQLARLLDPGNWFLTLADLDTDS